MLPHQRRERQEAADLGGLENDLCLALRENIYIPSTINARDFVVFMRISLTFFWPGESYQTFAFSVLSNAAMMNRFGKIPSRAVIFVVRAK